jgi:hypothetical protein
MRKQGADCESLITPLNIRRFVPSARGAPPFLGNRLLINIHYGPAMRRPVQILGRLDFHFDFPKQDLKPAAEGVPDDFPSDPQPFQDWPDRAPEHQVQRDWQGSVVYHRQEDEVVARLARRSSIRLPTLSFSTPRLIYIGIRVLLVCLDAQAPYATSPVFSASLKQKCIPLL